ncbi:MAG: hypothetical protein WDM91_00985 [Rhizomicrobium sp.]
MRPRLLFSANLFEAPMRAAIIVRGILNREAVRSWIAKITGTGPLVKVRGATARFTANTEQRLDGHNDVNDDPRLLGFTVGLSHEAFEDGLFELKPTREGAVTFRFHHARPFSWVIFPISKQIMRRVTPVTAGGPRPVFGGWYLGPRT